MTEVAGPKVDQTSNDVAPYKILEGLVVGIPLVRIQACTVVEAASESRDQVEVL